MYKIIIVPLDGSRSFITIAFSDDELLKKTDLLEKTGNYDFTWERISSAKNSRKKKIL